MIHISSSLVLAPATPALNANNPVIGYRNRATFDTLTATLEDADYPVTNLANPNTALPWIGEASGSDQYIIIVPGTADDLDYLAIAKHNFGSAGIEISVEIETAPATWTEEFAPFIPASDSPILFRFEPQPISGIRLKIAATAEIPQIAVLYLGTLLVLQRRIYVPHVPINYGRSIDVANPRSINGNFLGRIVTGSQLSTDVSLQNLTPSWVRTSLVPFLRDAETEPFFFAWRPGDYPDEVGFAWLTNDPRPQNQRSNGMMQIDFQMSGVA